jgi:hypothetical protein
VDAGRWRPDDPCRRTVTGGVLREQWPGENIQCVAIDPSGLDEAALREALDACLTDEELACCLDAWECSRVLAALG